MTNPSNPPATSSWNLTGRHALVTGGSRRVGRAIALRLAAFGANVTLHYRSDEVGAMDTAREIESLGGTAHVAQADLGSDVSIDALVRALREHTVPVDLLVNNAAAFEQTPLAELRGDAFDLHMQVNGRAVYLLTAALGRDMAVRSGGAVVNISCASAERPWAAYVPYSASKSVVNNLTHGFARALAPRVRVNAVAPGPILPPAGAEEDQGNAAVAKTLLKRWGKPNDVAAAVHFLAVSPYITGAVLAVDGGRSIA